MTNFSPTEGAQPLEARSGHKTLLKLLLGLTEHVLTQSVENKRAIELVEAAIKENERKLILIIKQLELITGEEDYGTN